MEDGMELPINERTVSDRFVISRRGRKKSERLLDMENQSPEFVAELWSATILRRNMVL